MVVTRVRGPAGRPDPVRRSERTANSTKRYTEDDSDSDSDPAEKRQKQYVSSSESSSSSSSSDEEDVVFLKDVSEEEARKEKEKKAEEEGMMIDLTGKAKARVMMSYGDLPRYLIPSQEFLKKYPGLSDVELHYNSPFSNMPTLESSLTNVCFTAPVEFEEDVSSKMIQLDTEKLKSKITDIIVSSMVDSKKQRVGEFCRNFLTLTWSQTNHRGELGVIFSPMFSVVRIGIRADAPIPTTLKEWNTSLMLMLARKKATNDDGSTNVIDLLQRAEYARAGGSSGAGTSSAGAVAMAALRIANLTLTDPSLFVLPKERKEYPYFVYSIVRRRNVKVRAWRRRAGK